MSISVSREADEQKHRVVKRRLGSNGASLCDRCLKFRGCSDGIATSNTNHTVAQREVAEKEDLSNTAARALELPIRWILRNPKNGQSLSHSLQYTHTQKYKSLQVNIFIPSKHRLGCNKVPDMCFQ